MKEIEIVIADDHPLLRQGLCRLLELEAGISVVGQANNGLEALSLVKELLPDLVLLDINMPDLNGVDVARNIRNDFPDIKLLVFTIHDERTYVNEMIRLGVHGYLLKDAKPHMVVTAIKKIMDGEIVYSPELMERVMECYHKLEVQYGRLQSAAALNELALTARETEVLGYIVEGLSNKEIAQTLFISEKTVKNHVTHLLKKLDVEDRTQAAVFAVREGLFSSD